MFLFLVFLPPPPPQSTPPPTPSRTLFMYIKQIAIYIYVTRLWMRLKVDRVSVTFPLEHGFRYEAGETNEKPVCYNIDTCSNISNCCVTAWFAHEPVHKYIYYDTIVNLSPISSWWGGGARWGRGNRGQERHHLFIQISGIDSGWFSITQLLNSDQKVGINCPRWYWQFVCQLALVVGAVHGSVLEF